MRFFEIKDYIEKIIGKGVKQGIGSWNQFKTRPTYLKFNESYEVWNQVYNFLYNNPDFKIIKRTKSGGIAKGCKSITQNMVSYDVKHSSSCARITIILGQTIYVLTCGRDSSSQEREVQPASAWRIFKEECIKNDINLDNYKIENGLEVKKEVPSPLIRFKNKYKDVILYNVHHIDFHNSYPAGLCNTHTEFKKVIEPLYKLRNIKPENKAILNYSVGCMHSKKFPWRAQWAHLAKDAITDNNNRILELSKRLEESGCIILGYNTDGIWYRGNIYHGQGEGDNLGQWHNDHTNCKFRAKSDGVYEYIENGIYHPVVRGSTHLDAIEPDRSNWKWGDIYNNPLYVFRFVEGVGIVRDEI